MSIMDYGQGRALTPKETLEGSIADFRHAIKRGEEHIAELEQQRSHYDEQIKHKRARLDEYREAIVKYEHAVEVLTRKAID